MPGQRIARLTAQRKRKPGDSPGFKLFYSTFECSLKFFVELAGRTRDIDSARYAAFAVLNALDDARGLSTLGTVSRLRRVHYLLTITGLCNLCHWSVSSPSLGVSALTRNRVRAASTSRSVAASNCTVCGKRADSLPLVYMKSILQGRCPAARCVRYKPGEAIGGTAGILRS